MDLERFEYRRETINLKEIFPNLNLEDLKRKFLKEDILKDPHGIILKTAQSLWDGSYDYILDNYGFHQDDYGKFSGHCHQITPALGLVLLAKGFQDVAYLEAFRADPKTGEKVPPEEEQSEMKEEFCSIGRIPYCCLEVKINGQTFYVSGKHLKGNKALLTPDCYIDMVGVFAHQNDETKSGIYLKQITDFPGVREGEPFVWIKQKINPETGKPMEDKEYFKTYAYMKLTL